jgi:hypothetical protein
MSPGRSSSTKARPHKPREAEAAHEGADQPAQVGVAFRARNFAFLDPLATVVLGAELVLDLEQLAASVGVHPQRSLDVDKAHPNTVAGTKPCACKTQQLREDHSIDHLWQEDVIDYHRRGARDLGAVVQTAPNDPEVLSRQSKGSLIDELLDPGEKMLVGLRDIAADDNHSGVEQVDRTCQRFTDQPTAFPHERDRTNVTCADKSNHVTGVLRFEALCTQALGHCTTARHRFETASISATTRDSCCLSDRHMANVTRRSIRSTQDLACGHDATADSCPDFDEQEVGDVGVVRALLT